MCSVLFSSVFSAFLQCAQCFSPVCPVPTVINQALDLHHLLPPAPHSILLQGKLALYAINTHTERKTHNKLSPKDFDTPQIILQVNLAITLVALISLLTMWSFYWNARLRGGLANWPWMYSSTGSAKFWQFVRHRLTTPPAPQAPTACVPSHSQPSSYLHCSVAYFCISHDNQICRFQPICWLRQSCS